MEYYRGKYAQNFGLSSEAAKQLASEQVRKLQEGLKDSEQYLIAAYLEHPEPIGGFWLSRTNTNHAIIQWILVEARYRQLGYGRQILDQVKTLAKNLGVHKLFIYAFADNHGALELYYQVGFTTIGFEMQLEL